MVNFTIIYDKLLFCTSQFRRFPRYLIQCFFYLVSKLLTKIYFSTNLFTYSINERSRSYLEKGKEMSHAPHYWTIIEIGTFETFWNCNSFLFCLRICWFLKGCMQWTGWWWWNHTAMTKSPRLTGLEASWARASCRWQMKQSTTVVVGSNFQLLTSCSISKISIGSSE